MRLRNYLAAALGGAALSCSSSGSEPSGPAAVTVSTISVVAGSGQSGTIGTALSTPITVEAKGSNGLPFAGATVTFSGSNGGTANPATATTGTNGRASTTWTLGSVVAGQTLTASAGASIHATVTANAMATVTIASISVLGGSGQSGTVGTALGTPITVEVRGSDGLVYPNASVSFAVTHSGSISPASGTTDAQGRLATTWTLGATAATQSLTATTGAFQATVSATAMPITVASVTVVSGGSQTGVAGVELPNPVVVEVKGSNGLIMANTPVSISVNTSGSANPVSGVTNSAGRFSTLWTLGPLAQVQALTATAGTHSVIANATATVNICLVSTAFTIGTTVTGNLFSGDCALLPAGDGVNGYTDRYSYTVPGGSVGQRLTATSSTVDTYLRVRDSAGRLVAWDDQSGGGNNAYVSLLASTGSFTVELTSWAHGATGSYSLVSSATSSSDIGEQCATNQWIVKNTTATGRVIDPTDCYGTFSAGTLPAGARSYDRYVLVLAPGQSATITMSSAPGTPYSFDTFLIARDVAAGTFVYDDDSAGGASGTDSRLTITAPNTGSQPVVYYIDCTTYVTAANLPLPGTYVLTIN